MSAGKTSTNNSIETVLSKNAWNNLEKYLDDIGDSIDKSIKKSNDLRVKYREEILNDHPQLREQIKTPSLESLKNAEYTLTHGTVAASDGTLSIVPLIGGSKMQVGVVIVYNTGNCVDYVTRVNEVELADDASSAKDYFTKLREARKFSNLLSRAIMLYGERNLLLDHKADWRMIHGEIIPHELRTGAGNPAKNLHLAFDIARRFIKSKKFIAVSESSNDIDVLNAAVLLEPGEYIVVHSIGEILTSFLDGNEKTGQAKANFIKQDERKFRDFIKEIGDEVSIVLVKAGHKPFLIECHAALVEEAVALFFADSLWSRGYESNDGYSTVRPFPYHIDLADQVARTLLKGSEFQNYVEKLLFKFNIESGVFDLDARRTRM